MYLLTAIIQFFRFYSREDADACFKFINGTRLDDRTIRTDWDVGFVEGRQYGRGKSGGQVIETPTFLDSIEDDTEITPR